ncbi:hypothetical protein RJT34_22485 [Clitoria ternatea]|uniref:Carbohydrate kinase PfkB domain-containing protein n=1 Tax=Clitoria ternatea TaxID=43366 RepID=A0AAN9FJ75_CLITE
MSRCFFSEAIDITTCRMAPEICRLPFLSLPYSTSSPLSRLCVVGVYLSVAEECNAMQCVLVNANHAFSQNIPILIDAERPREGLNDLLELADYVVCSENFPKASITYESLARQALTLSLLVVQVSSHMAWNSGKFLIYIASFNVLHEEESHLEELDVDNCLKSLTKRKDGTTAMPTCIASSVTKLGAAGIGSACGRLYFASAEHIPPSELIDTTGAGDAFVGAILYAICSNLSPEKMLPFASYVLPIVEHSELVVVFRTALIHTWQPLYKCPTGHQNIKQSMQEIRLQHTNQAPTLAYN